MPKMSGSAAPRGVPQRNDEPAAAPAVGGEIDGHAAAVANLFLKAGVAEDRQTVFPVNDLRVV